MFVKCLFEFVHDKVYHELSLIIHISMSFGITAKTWKDLWLWWKLKKKDNHLASTTVGPNVIGLDQL